MRISLKRTGVKLSCIFGIEFMCGKISVPDALYLMSSPEFCVFYAYIVIAVLHLLVQR